MRSECIRDFIQKTRYSITRLTCFEIAHGLPVFTAAGGERYNPGQSMTLASGIRLGPYEIQTRLGAGGMGEVYRAHDTRLGRDVAVKVLPQHLSCNPELKARFEREARAISALSDPHICHLYDIGSQGGTDFLVMELLDGESLADRLHKGPLPLRQALQYGIDIAEALDVAHKNGIVHRDLKPANVMLTRSGAKLLDFGLAKPNVVAVGPMGSSGSISELTPSTPTMSIAALSTPGPALTQQGLVVGTFQYMAPEVLQGQEADARSDLFALGTVLYEMISGKRAFEGKSPLSVITAILEKEPERMTHASPTVEHVIRACLAKDPSERMQSAREVVRELRWVAEAPLLAEGAELATAQRSRRWLLWIAVTGAAACAMLFAIMYVSLARGPGQMMRSYIPPPEKASFAFNGDAAGPVVISPNGSAIAFVADDADAKHMLWVRELNADSARSLAGTEGATFPFWSPDGRFLGFFADGKLKVIDIGGGAAAVLCEAPQGRGGAWNQEGIIIFSSSFQGPIYKIPAAGGIPAQITKVDASQHDSHRWPVFLPDGKHFLYLAVSHRNPSDPADAVYLGSLDGKETRLVMHSIANAVLGAGHILFLHGNQLMAQEFDVKMGKILGSPSRIADDVQNDPTTWHGSFDVSKNGILVHGRGGGAESELRWFDRSGRQISKVGSPELRLFNLRLSPKGDRLATEASSDIWIYDLARNVRTRLTFNGQNQFPAWSPDGEWVAFGGAPSANFVPIERKRSNGSGEVETLLKSNGNPIPNDWSPDGRFLLYTEGLVGSGQTVWALPLSGDRRPTAVTTRQEGIDQSDAAFSPDGRWVAYSSTESGQSEVYIMPFNRNGGRWQVSTSGGNKSRWSRDSKELFYIALDRTLMSVPVMLSKDSPKLGAPQPLFRTSIVGFFSLFDVSSDGKRFVIASTVQSQNAPLALVVNWTELLKK